VAHLSRRPKPEVAAALLDIVEERIAGVLDAMPAAVPRGLLPGSSG
jgi:hypothetical protein